MTKLEIAKRATSFIVAAGTSKIVNSIIQNNTAPETVTDKVTITGASVVIGSMAADATSTYTGAKIDEIAAWYRANVKK